MQNDLGFLQDIRTRINLKGKGAKSIVLGNNKIYVAMYYSGSVVELASNVIASSNIISLGRHPTLSSKRLDEIYFSDVTLCK